MEANINTQDVGAKKPSLLGMITSQVSNLRE